MTTMMEEEEKEKEKTKKKTTMTYKEQGGLIYKSCFLFPIS